MKHRCFDILKNQFKGVFDLKIHGEFVKVVFSMTLESELDDVQWLEVCFRKSRLDET